MDRTQLSAALDCAAVRTPGAEPVGLLPGTGRRDPREPAADAADRRAISQDTVLWQPPRDGLADQAGRGGQSQTSATLDGNHGLGGDPPRAADDRDEQGIKAMHLVKTALGALRAVVLTALMVTALSVARERELGTFAQLLVSPLSPGEIVVGKSVPAFMIGIMEGTLMVLASVFLFDTRPRKAAVGRVEHQ